MNTERDKQIDGRVELPAVDSRSTGETALAAFKIVCSLFPFGGTAVEIINSVLTPAVTKRTQKWIEYIAGRLVDLESRVDNFKVENLAENEVFVSLFLEASQAAVRTHKQQKREYLGNAVVNCAWGIDIDHDLQPAFVRFLSELNVLHVTLLQFVMEHQEVVADFDHVSSYKLFRRRYLERYNHVGATREEFALAVADLKSRALLSVSQRVDTDSGVFEYMLPSVEKGGSAAPFTAWRPGPMIAITRLGREFLRFVATKR